MPPLRPRPAPTDRGRAAVDIANSLAAPRLPSDMRTLIRDAGGTRRAAEMVNRSPRTLRRWAAGGVQNIPEPARRTLSQASATSRNQQLIEEMGGVRRVAQITGRSVRTVQRWARGEIRHPKPDAQRLLGRADAAVRMRARGLSIDPATGRPITPIHLQLNGAIRINASRTKGYAYPARNIGTGGMNPLGFELDPDVIAQIVEAIGQGDTRGAHATLEAHLSDSYAAVGAYDQQAEIGMFIDAITDIAFNQEPPPPAAAPTQPRPAARRVRARRSPEPPRTS